MTRSSIVLLLLTNFPSPSVQQINYQPFSDERDYCTRESTQLGLCLGMQQQTQLDFTNEILYDCIQCSGSYRGDETCQELKQIHNTTSTVEDSTNVVTGEAEAISGGDLSFCETYNNCVRTKCPPVCWKEHVRWLECVIVEIDCDLGCESVELGHGFVGEEFVLGVTNSGRKESSAAALILGMVGFWWMA